MLKVTVAEVRRDTLKELGINLSGSLSVGNATIGFNSTRRRTRPTAALCGISTAATSI